MSVVWNKLLEDALQLEAVRAAAVLAPQRPVISRTSDPGRAESTLAPVWRYLGDTAEVCAHHRLSPQQMRWIFERVLVYCQRRADGLMLALIVARGRNLGFDATGIERLFEEFRMLRDE